MIKNKTVEIKGIHHIAIICSNYQVSKKFYTEIMGFRTVREVYRKERDSFKLDLEVGGKYQIELFSFPTPPSRPSRPEATGLRHLAFEIENIEAAVSELKSIGLEVEEIRMDEFTGKKFTFFSDPDNLPIELYQL